MLRKYEEEKKVAEAKAAEEAAKGGKPPPKGKAPAPAAKKGKEQEKPPIDIPQLEIPPVVQYKSDCGNIYVFERSIEYISD